MNNGLSEYDRCIALNMVKNPHLVDIKRTLPIGKLNMKGTDKYTIFYKKIGTKLISSYNVTDLEECYARGGMLVLLTRLWPCN